MARRCVARSLWPLLLGAATLDRSAAQHFDLDPFSVVAGRHFSFVVNDFRARATGRNNYGQLGIGSIEDKDRLVDVELPREDNAIKEIAAGGYHTLFLTDKGNVYAAGWNRFGQLGVGSSDVFHHTPVLVDVGGSANATGVAAGYGHSLVLLCDGTVWSAGLNAVGQLGDGTTGSRSSLAALELGTADQATKIAAGYDFSYILMESGSVWATGQNLAGQLGDATGMTRLRPVEVHVEGIVADIAAGESHGLFLMADGSVLGAGANFDGQLGNGTLEKIFTPAAIEYADASHLALAGGDSSCLISSDDRRLVCMGSNRDGQLGFGSDAKVDLTLVPEMPGEVVCAALGDSHSLFLAHPGDVFITGSNLFGELGGNTTDRDTVEVLTRLNFARTTRTSTTNTGTTSTDTMTTITATLTSVTATTTTTSTTTASTTTASTTTSTTTTTTSVARDINARPPSPLLSPEVLQGVGVAALVLAVLWCFNSDPPRGTPRDAMREEPEQELAASVEV